MANCWNQFRVWNQFWGPFLEWAWNRFLTWKRPASDDEAAEEAEEESSDDEWVAQSQQVCYKYDKY